MISCSFGLQGRGRESSAKESEGKKDGDDKRQSEEVRVGCHRLKGEEGRSRARGKLLETTKRKGKVSSDSKEKRRDGYARQEVVKLEVEREGVSVSQRTVACLYLR